MYRFAYVPQLYNKQQHYILTTPVYAISRSILTLTRYLSILFLNIYTTKIGTFVCPPHISETVADRIMKLAHRPRIASTTKKTHFKTNLTVNFINFIKNNSANQRWPEAQIVAAICLR